MQKLNIKAFAIAAGTLWGLYVLCGGWMAMFGWGTGIVGSFSSLYIGYNASFIGGVIGGIWGFFDGAVAGAIIACIYNALLKK